MTNVSLGILCAVLFLKGVGRSWTPRALLYSLLVCVAVVVINVGRISLIGLHPDQYELLHGTVGSTVAGWLTTAAILGICAYGLGREASPAA
jgi:exosortase/archaeosortase family protein